MRNFCLEVCVRYTWSLRLEMKHWLGLNSGRSTITAENMKTINKLTFGNHTAIINYQSIKSSHILQDDAIHL